VHATKFCIAKSFKFIRRKIMKKTIFTFLFIVTVLFLSTSLVFATENNFENIKNNMVDTVNNAGNVVGDTASGTAGAVKDGINNVGNATQNMTNDVKNGSENMANDMNNGMNNMDYEATRTSTENNNNTPDNSFNNTWTWIIFGIIALVVIGLVWYYVTQNNH
jgi:CHASE3 domain sensor protein